MARTRALLPVRLQQPWPVRICNQKPPFDCTALVGSCRDRGANHFGGGFGGRGYFPGLRENKLPICALIGRRFVVEFRISLQALSRALNALVFDASFVKGI
jgi:hypothetical protein